LIIILLIVVGLVVLYGIRLLMNAIFDPHINRARAKALATTADTAPVGLRSSREAEGVERASSSVPASPAHEPRIEGPTDGAMDDESNSSSAARIVSPAATPARRLQPDAPGNGKRWCVTGSCERYGVKTDDRACPVCGYATQSV
jgi:hypothetical protein